MKWARISSRFGMSRLTTHLLSTLGMLSLFGNPAAGAGNIETPGVWDRYTFTATPGQRIFFDTQGTTAYWCDLPVSLKDSNGSTIFSEGCYGDPVGSYLLSEGGTYTLTVNGYGDEVGTYQFQIWDVPVDDPFAINIGDVISDGNPVAGAGNIETPGVWDTYTFTATPDQTIFFDTQGTTAYWCDLPVTLEDRTGTTIFNGGCYGDPVGSYLLSEGGTYTLTVNGYGDEVGTYQFQIWDVPVDDPFAINIGDVISDGNPVAGAGNIETPGVWDTYTFTSHTRSNYFLRYSRYNRLLV